MRDQRQFARGRAGRRGVGRRRDEPGVGAPLSYPVALDTTGRVADGYGVQDQPWLVLVSASGRALWSHDGWLLPPALIAAVRHALKR